MSAHAVTICGYLILVVTGVSLELAARRPGSPVPSLWLLVGRIMSTRAGRVAVMTGWAWLGLHLFAL
jgi:hypothetical protein